MLRIPAPPASVSCALATAYLTPLAVPGPRRRRGGWRPQAPAPAPHAHAEDCKPHGHFRNPPFPQMSFDVFGQQELIADNRDEINNWRIALGPVMGERWASLPEQSPGIASAVPTTALAPLEVSTQAIPDPLSPSLVIEHLCLMPSFRRMDWCNFLACDRRRGAVPRAWRPPRRSGGWCSGWRSEARARKRPRSSRPCATT